MQVSLELANNACANVFDATMTFLCLPHTVHLVQHPHTVYKISENPDK